MPGANVTSSEAIEAFRAALLVYLSKARPILDDTNDDVSRTREWIENDRRLHWENEVRRRAKVLEQAQQALYSARLSNLRDVTTAEQAAVNRAKRALNDAEDKLRLVKRWALEFDRRAAPLVKQLEQARTILGNDMPKAVAYLAQVVKAIDAYVGMAPTAGGSSGEVSETESLQTSPPLIDSPALPTNGINPGADKIP